MKKYDLLRSGDSIIRVLEVQGGRVLVIDCIKRTMPMWMDAAELESYSECTTRELSQVTGIIPVEVDALDADQRKIMYERYTMIAPILPFVADDRMRSRLIGSIATEHEVSKQTVRNYLGLYLSYMDVAALAPKHREDDRALTQDEKNIRWALNHCRQLKHYQSKCTNICRRNCRNSDLTSGSSHQDWASAQMRIPSLDGVGNERVDYGSGANHPKTAAELYGRS